VSGDKFIKRENKIFCSTSSQVALVRSSSKPKLAAKERFGYWKADCCSTQQRKAIQHLVSILNSVRAGLQSNEILIIL